MGAATRKALAVESDRVYDHIGDAVGMTEEEKELLDLRITLAISVRKRREKLGLSQKELATRLKVGERRVAKIEWSDPAISLDEILRAYSALGGRVTIKELPPYSAGGAKNGARPAKKKTRATA